MLYNSRDMHRLLLAISVPTVFATAAIIRILFSLFVVVLGMKRTKASTGGQK